MSYYGKYVLGILIVAVSSTALGSDTITGKIINATPFETTVEVTMETQFSKKQVNLSIPPHSVKGLDVLARDLSGYPMAGVTGASVKQTFVATTANGNIFDPASRQYTLKQVGVRGTFSSNNSADGFSSTIFVIAGPLYSMKTLVGGDGTMVGLRDPYYTLTEL